MPQANAKKVSVSDIAQEAGVSVATVSKVINGRPDVSEATRKRIESIIQARGYTKRGRKGMAMSQAIELVLPLNLPSGTPEILATAAHRSYVESFAMSITQVPENADDRLELMRRIVGNNPLGVVFFLEDTHNDELDMFTQRDIPFVVIDLPGNVSQNHLIVGVDNWSGGLLAGRYLMEHGHRHIGAVTGSPSSLASQARLSGLSNAMAEAGLTLSDDDIATGNFRPDGGREGASKLLRRDDRPTAVFAFNDLMAMGVYQVAMQLGLRIPEDLSVIGFDNVFPSMYMYPPLTTIYQPFGQLMDSAIDLILAQRNNEFPDNEQQRIILPPQLVERASVATVPSAE